MGEFIDEHRAGKPVGRSAALAHKPLDSRRELAAQILPALRGAVSSNRRVIAHYTDTDDALTFAGSRWAKELSRLGTSCPDHFLRTRICPFFVDWDPAAGDVDALKAAIRAQVVRLPRRLHAATTTRTPRRIRRSCATRTRRSSSFRARPVRVRQEQEGSAHHDRVLPERHQRDGRRHGAREPAHDERSDPLPQARRRNRPLSSSSSTTTSRCRARRRSASSTGRSRKPSCSGCPPRRSSAARS